MSSRRIIRTGRWLPVHEQWLEANYALLGGPACAKHLKRSAKSIRCKAQSLNVSQLIGPAGHRSISDLAREANLTPSAVQQAANVDNAIVGGTRAKHVTDEWATAFLIARRSRERARDLLDAGALRLPQAARELGITPRTLRGAIKRGTGPIALALAGRYTTGHARGARGITRYVFQAAHVLDAARKLRESSRQGAA